MEHLITTSHQQLDRFSRIEQRPWGAEGAQIELSKQVGQLSALLMAQEKYYFANLRLARHYGIDFTVAYEKFLIEQDEYLTEKGV
jgi:hypothetical protein